MGNRRNVNVDETTSSTKKIKQTKNSGQKRGRPVDLLSARSARRQTTARKDTCNTLLAIYDKGHCYSEDEAMLRNTETSGSYVDHQCTVMLDPDDAYDIFCLHNYEGQRCFDQAHSTRLAQVVTTATSIDFAIGPDGKAVLVNGQHTMWAIYMRGRPTEACLKFYQCRDSSAIAFLYATFDDNKKRSLANAIHAAQGAGSLTYEGKDSKLGRWAQAAAVAEAGFTRKSISKEARSRQVERACRTEIQEFARFMDNNVKDAIQGKLVPQGIAAAFYAMFISDLHNASKFIVGYTKGINLDESNPAFVIRNKMLNRPHGQHGSTVVRDHAELMYTAWRKFCLGESLVSCRRTMDLPKCDRWKIFKSAKKETMALNIGSGSAAVAVAVK